MMDQLYIGIDSGTQGSKVVVFSREKGRILAESSQPHTLIENERGGREQEPSAWLEAIEKAVGKVLKQVDPGLVKGIGVSGQQHGFVPLDGNGNVIRPAKLWCDTETVAQCQAITDKLGGEEKVIEEIGNAVAVGFTASKILWLKETEPENYSRLRTILLPHDYLNYWLTGEFSTEHGDASGTAYYDVRKRSWSEKVLNVVDSDQSLLDFLPPLREAYEPSGYLRSDLAKRWGMGNTVLVASGGGDNMMAAIGTGNVRPGVVTASLGTSGTIYGYSDSPVVDNQGEVAAFCSSSGGWLPLVCTMNVTVATELFRGLLGDSLEEFNAQVAQAKLGSEGMVLLPFFNGERTPALPLASATLYGMTSVNFTKPNFCRASMEGVTLGLRYGVEALERNGIIPTEIRLVGGGAKSDVWRQMVADIFNTPVVSPITMEAGALGAALQALWCNCSINEGRVEIDEICQQYVAIDEKSRVKPIASRAEIYKEVYERYCQLEKMSRSTYL